MNIYQQTHKHCIYCNITKHITEFYKDNSSKDGIKIRCKQCDFIYQQSYHKKRKALKLIEKQSKTTKLCKICKVDKPFIEFNKSSTIKDGYKTTCIQCNNNAIVERKLKRKAQTIANIPKQKEKQRNYMVIYTREKRKKDPLFKLKNDIRGIIGRCLRDNRYTKHSKTHSILGCSFDQFFNHIEQQFVEGMSWDNRNQWHIDHIVPISFGINETEIILLNHYTNLKPLWAVDNIIKSNKLTEEVVNHPIYKSIIELRYTQNFDPP